MSTLLKIALLCGLSACAWATENKLEKIEVATDLPSLERGVATLMATCHTCHSLKYIRYRDLLSLGMDKEKVNAWRGEQPLEASIMAQMSENDAAAAYGKAPPDLSLMTKARTGGADYVYSYLLAYYVNKEGVLGNHIYPETKMPDILGISGAGDAAQRDEIQRKARDIVSFLAWASDPHERERHQLGYYVLAYLFVLTTLLYFVKKQVWASLE